ncbi:hypothetical protein [Halobacillus mangrovi]|uniref:WYL domain-containing protein n=1 Tax=Halobacillus mangrovi TaxID=402384 RepID=A0A1W5ZVY3_9BACI|nr:hypothetical protein [Halobacillus mangrovi]ARI77419.1 hypothetical protein HM131_11455 [Halobacillus mangrovi]
MSDLMVRAKEEKAKIEIIYMSGQGTLTQRMIRVIAIRDTYILAYCFNRKEVRAFHTENILSAFPITNSRGVGA